MSQKEFEVEVIVKTTSLKTGRIFLKSRAASFARGIAEKTAVDDHGKLKWDVDMIAPSSETIASKIVKQ